MRKFTPLAYGLITLIFSGAFTACRSDDDNSSEDSAATGGQSQTQKSGGTHSGSGGAVEPGSAGASNSAGAAGENGNDSAASGLGTMCESNLDCPEGLDCIQENSGKLNGGGPAHGMCSKDCSQDENVCQKIEPGSLCAVFSDSDAYCTQRCAFGLSQAPVFNDIEFDVNKCQGRDDFACTPQYVDTGVDCSTDDECNKDSACFGTCYLVVPTCIPQCGRDEDCGSGFCHPSGVCQATKPEGKRLAEACDPNATVDECNGSCRPYLNGAGEIIGGACDETCVIGRDGASCGFDGDGGQAAACHFAAEVIKAPDWGDSGLCAAYCDCDEECTGLSKCIPTAYAGFGKAGICDSPFDALGQPLDTLTCAQD